MSNLIERLRERVRMLATPAGGDMVVKLFPKEVMEIADALEAMQQENEQLDEERQFWKIQAMLSGISENAYEGFQKALENHDE